MHRNSIRFFSFYFFIVYNLKKMKKTKHTINDTINVESWPLKLKYSIIEFSID